jgi:hypothetical protein
MRKSLNILISLASLAGGARAFALEDHAVLQGQFDWIIRDGGDDIDRDVKRHLMKTVKIDRQPNGLFRMDITMPATLSGGVELKTTYWQKPVPVGPTTPEDELYFETIPQPGQQKDYLKCFAEQDESWEGASCDEITLHSLNQVPLAQRLAYSKQHYGGTDLDAGMSQAVNAISGAQPGGSMKLFEPENRNFAPWVGTWAITYTSPNGQAVNATMYFDGFSGSYGSGNSHGALRNTYVEGSDTAGGDWDMGDQSGYFEFHAAGPGRFTGTWHNFDETQQGTWNGTRIN